MRALILSTLILTSCTSAPPNHVYKRQNLPQPTLDNFPVCRSYGCAKIDMQSLSKKDISNIKNIFKTNNNTEKEIQSIKKYIAFMEREIGARTGTSEDVGGTYTRLGPWQQDCVDESTNTTTYLILADQLNLLKFHDVLALTSRAPILSGRLGPHRTAVIQNKDTGEKFAVDSWFHDNGIEPEIVPLDDWRWGWHP